MSLSRTILTIGLLLGLGLAVGPYTARRFPTFWREHRLKRFDVDASRSAAYRLDSTNWLEFDIPRQALGLRILTNAAVQDLSRRVTTREEPRDGWRYAIEYELLTGEGHLLDSHHYHLRASVLKDRDPSTGAERSASWFGNLDWLPTMTRTVQLPLESAAQPPDRLRVRLAKREEVVQEVTVRVFMRYERTDYDQPYVWSRLSPEARERLARPSVYPPALLTAIERKNLARWDWTALPPLGLEGQDYQTRWFYQAAPEPEACESVARSNLGLTCEPTRHLVLTLPDDTTRVRLELENLHAYAEATQNRTGFKTGLREGEAPAEPGLSASSARQEPRPPSFETGSKTSTASQWDVRSQAMSPSPTHVGIRWVPSQPGPDRMFRTKLSGSHRALELPVGGGWLEIRTTDSIACRAYRNSSSEPDRNTMIPLEDTSDPLRTFLAPPDAPLEYAITSFRNQPTPFCLTLRRFETESTLTHDTLEPVSKPEPRALASGQFSMRLGESWPAASAVGSQTRSVTVLKPLVTSHEIPLAQVEYRFLDAEGQELRRGVLTTNEELSCYDRAYGSQLKGPVTESASYYFTLGPQVRRIEVRASDSSVGVSAFTRPMDLARTWRIPEDQRATSDEESQGRTWFLLQPQDADARLDRNLAVTVITQTRPPRRDPRILAGDYSWEDFEPLGFWKGRYLLVPRDSQQAVRPAGLRSTFCQVPTNRAVAIRLRREPDRPRIEPRLIYSSTSSASGRVQVWLDGQLWHAFRPQARRGEQVLPPLPTELSTSEHTIRIDAPQTMRLSLSHLQVRDAPLYSKRMASQLENGRLRFPITKRSSAAEGLILRPFLPSHWTQRTRIQVRILGGPNAEGPFPNLTLRTRAFDLLPDTESMGLVLGTEDQFVDGGQRCFIRLAEDLPAGEYTVEIELQEPQPETAYAVLYRVIPGSQPERDVELLETAIEFRDRSSPRAIGASATSEVALVPSAPARSSKE